MSELIEADGVPLCIDLDGTLIQEDVFRRSVGRLLVARPWSLGALVVWSLQGRPVVKRRVAALDPLRASDLRYNLRLLSRLREARSAARQVLLVTGAIQAEAEKVAAHLGLFDEVLGTRPGCNLTGRRKAAVLVARFGDGGFDYAGNSRADLPVWRHARQAWVIGGSERLVRAARCITEVTWVQAATSSDWGGRLGEDGPSDIPGDRP